MNPLDLPKQDEVEEFDYGNEKIKLVTITDENRNAVFETCLQMEPCRICGELLTREDVNTAVYAGYSDCSRSRSAHKECWEANKPQNEWAYPVTASSSQY